MGKEEGFDVPVGRLERRRERNERPARRGDRLRARDPRLLDPPAALADRVLDEPGDDATGQLVDDAGRFESRMEASISARTPATNGTAARISESGNRPARRPSSMSWAS